LVLCQIDCKRRKRPITRYLPLKQKFLYNTNIKEKM